MCYCDTPRFAVCTLVGCGVMLAARACAAAPPADEAGVLSSRFDVVLVLT